MWGESMGTRVLGRATVLLTFMSPNADVAPLTRWAGGMALLALPCDVAVRMPTDRPLLTKRSSLSPHSPQCSLPAIRSLHPPAQC